MSPSVIGIDIGGTKIALERYNAETWEIEASARVQTKANESMEAVLDDVVAMVEHNSTPDTKAIGIGIPGLIKRPDDMLINAPNIANSKNIYVRQYLEKKLKLPFGIENDANCFALAEAVNGPGKGHKVAIGIIVGTGVGGGIIVDGKIFAGAHGFAGELGHMLLKPGQPPYPTDDKRGEVEQFFSGPALGRRCEAAKRPEDYLRGEVCAFLRPDVFIEIAWMCCNLIYAVDPSVIIFGGSTGKALEPHLNTIADELKKWLLPNTPLPELAISAQRNSGSMGAAIVGLQQL